MSIFDAGARLGTNWANNLGRKHLLSQTNVEIQNRILA